MTNDAQAVWVRWHDARMDEHETDTISAITDSIGWLVVSNRKCIKIAQSHYPVEDDLCDNDKADVLTIPRGMVVGVREVRSFHREA